MKDRPIAVERGISFLLLVILFCPICFLIGAVSIKKAQAEEKGVVCTTLQCIEELRVKRINPPGNNSPREPSPICKDNIRRKWLEFVGRGTPVFTDRSRIISPKPSQMFSF